MSEAVLSAAELDTAACLPEPSPLPVRFGSTQFFSELGVAGISATQSTSTYVRPRPGDCRAKCVVFRPERAMRDVAGPKLARTTPLLQRSEEFPKLREDAYFQSMTREVKISPPQHLGSIWEAFGKHSGRI